MDLFPAIQHGTNPFVVRLMGGPHNCHEARTGQRGQIWASMGRWQYGRNMDHAEKAVGQLIVSGGDGAVDLEMAEHALDAITLRNERLQSWREIQNTPLANQP